MVLIQCCNCLGICPNRNNSFFRYKDGPGNAIKCTFEGGLKDLVSANRSRGTRKMYYSKVCASLGFQKNDSDIPACFTCGSKRQAWLVMVEYSIHNCIRIGRLSVRIRFFLT